MSNHVLLTPEQKEYLIAHINDRPRAAVARAAGVSLSTMYLIVRENGGEMLHERAKRNPEWERIVRQHYPTMSGHEIERRFGITPNRANKIAQDLGIRHATETVERLRNETRERLEQSRKYVDQKAKAKRWRATRTLDQYRIWEGKPQKTAFRFATMTKRAYKSKHYLIRKYGYIADKDEPYTLLYDVDTLRRPSDSHKCGSESYYKEKYKLRFKQKTNEDSL